MNKTPSEAAAWATEISKLVDQVKTGAELMIAPSYTHLDGFIKGLNGAAVAVAAQDLSQHESGAYTGEVSAAMIKDLGATYVIVGHSERRAYHHESNEIVNTKIKRALEHNLRPILCVGESEEEREAGKAKDVVLSQLKNSLASIEFDKAADLVVAYEPVWAIGTGKTATSDDAEEMCAVIRESLKDLYPKKYSEIRILYGGSMKPSNAKELLSKPNINGGLIGGASLKTADFLEIANSA